MTNVFPSTWMYNKDVLPYPSGFFGGILMSCEEDVFSQDRCVLVVREVCFPLCSIPPRLFWDIWMNYKASAVATDRSVLVVHKGWGESA